MSLIIKTCLNSQRVAFRLDQTGSLQLSFNSVGARKCVCDGLKCARVGGWVH